MKCCSKCFCCCCGWNWWIGSYFRSSWYFRYYTVYWPCQIKLYFAVNQNLIEWYPKIKYFNGTLTSVSNLLLLSGVPPFIYVLYSKDLLAIVFSLFTQQRPSLFSSASLFTYSTIFPKTSSCHRIIATVL